MASMSAPVTTSVTRHVDPSRTTEMLAWVQAGTSLAERFDGFLGSGWVRPSEDSTDWHMLYRFADAESLARWEASPQRALQSAHVFSVACRRSRVATALVLGDLGEYIGREPVAATDDGEADVCPNTASRRQRARRA